MIVRYYKHKYTGKEKKDFVKKQKLFSSEFQNGEENIDVLKGNTLYMKRVFSDHYTGKNVSEGFDKMCEDENFLLEKSNQKEFEKALK